MFCESSADGEGEGPASESCKTHGTIAFSLQIFFLHRQTDTINACPYYDAKWHTCFPEPISSLRMASALTCRFWMEPPVEGEVATVTHRLQSWEQGCKQQRRDDLQAARNWTAGLSQVSSGQGKLAMAATKRLLYM